jgi:branched-chain amino acid transport system permease protein
MVSLGLALALSFYVIRVINFAQGQMLTIAIVVAASLSEAGYSPWIGVALGPIAACAIGVVSYFGAVRPILKADRFSFGRMVSTLGFGLALENAIAYVIGPRSRAFPPLLNDIGLHLGGALLTTQQILAIAVAAVIVVALVLVRRWIVFGKVGMATASDLEMAECIGANTMMVAAVTFALSGLLAGIAGVLIVPRTFANPYLGGTFNTFGFVAMMIGGAENPAFVMYGGILSEGANPYINSQHRTGFRSSSLCWSCLLGRVDEFHQANACGETDDGSEVLFGLFASERDPLEALEPSDALLDAGAGLVEGACKEDWLVLFVGLVRNDGSDAARSRGGPIGLAGVTLVADDGAGLNVRLISSRVSK